MAAEKETKAKQFEIIKARKTVANGAQTKEEMALLMAPYSSWEEFLMPAPMAVSMLGTLMGLATESDFSLVESAPDGGFHVLDNPKSFRGCLVQVANSGWKAFNLAQKNMDQIRLLCGQVPGHLKTAMSILFRQSIEDIIDMMPIELEQIAAVAEKGHALSSEVEQMFLFVIDAIDELQVACVVSKGSHEEKIKSNKAKKEAFEVRQKELKERKEHQKQLFDEDKKKLAEAEETFKKYCDDMPSSMKLLGMQLAENLVNQVGSMVPIFAMRYTPPMMMQPQPVVQPQNRVGVPVQVVEVSPELSGLEIQITELTNLCKEDSKDEEESIAEQNSRKEQVQKYMELARTKSEVDNPEEKKIFEEFIAICQEMIDAKDMSQKAMAAIIKKLNVLNKRVKVLVCKANRFAQPLASGAPMANTKLVGASATASAVSSARFKVECSKENLKDTRASYEKKVDDFNKTSKLLMDTMEELGSLNLKEINYQKIKEVLSQGIEVLADLKKQWGKVVEFFQMIGSIINCCLETTVKNFLQAAGQTQDRMLGQLGGPQYTLTDYRKDLIYKKAFQAAKVAYLVSMIAQTYVKVSKEHIMDKIAGVTKIFAYDSETEADLITKARDTLIEECIAAQEEIRCLVVAEKEKFDKQIGARLDKIGETYDKALPPPTEEEQEIIETAIAEAHHDLDDYL